MKKNELKKIAMQLAALQKQLDKATDKRERNKIETAIIKLTNKVDDVEDLFVLDELILKFLN